MNPVHKYFIGLVLGVAFGAKVYDRYHGAEDKEVWNEAQHKIKMLTLIRSNSDPVVREIQHLDRTTNTWTTYYDTIAAVTQMRHFTPQQRLEVFPPAPAPNPDSTLIPVP